MAGERFTPEVRRSPAPKQQPQPDDSGEPTLTSIELEGSARLRLRATAGKAFPAADEEDVERSRERGGPHPDVPPTEVAPPTA